MAVTTALADGAKTKHPADCFSLDPRVLAGDTPFNNNTGNEIKEVDLTGVEGGGRRRHPDQEYSQ